MSNVSVNRSEPEVGARAAEVTNFSPFVVRARLVFKAMVMLLAICILIQVFLAGLALFWDSAQWASHRGFAILLIIFPILMLVVSFVARLPLSIRLRSAGLIGIVILIAVVAKLPSGVGYLSALHPVLAMMLFFGAVSLIKRTDALNKEKKQAPAEQSVPRR